VRRGLAFFVLVVALGAPSVELFDRWDPTGPDATGSDTEANVMTVALCVGAGFVLTNAALSVSVPAGQAIATLARSAMTCRLRSGASTTIWLLPPRARPPTLLRI
jgi:hypothetical protein